MATSRILPGDSAHFPISLAMVGMNDRAMDMFNKLDVDVLAYDLLRFLKERNEGWEPFSGEEFATWCSTNGVDYTKIMNWLTYKQNMGKYAISQTGHLVEFDPDDGMIYVTDYYVYGVFSAWWKSNAWRTKPAEPQPV